MKRYKTIAAVAGGMLLVGFGPVRAQPAQKPPDRQIHVEIETGFRFDNNAFLDRRGQFGAEAVAHLVGIVGFTGELTLNPKKWFSFGFSTEVVSEELRIDLNEGKTTDELRKTSVKLSPSLTFTPVKEFKATITPALDITRESEQAWSFIQIQPTADLVWTTRFGLQAELSYAFTGKFFDSGEDTETYANVGMLGHRTELTLKLWIWKFLRTRLTGGFERQIYEDNIGILLGRIVFLPIDQYENPNATFTPEKRKDFAVRGEGEVLGVPFKWGAVAVGYRYEEILSNFDPFTYRGHGPRLAIAFTMKGHEAYVEGKLTWKHGYRFRFDTRYQDKKKDFKVDLYAAYGWKIKDWVRVDLSYSFLRNDSNDAARFEFGHSRSYSLYQRSKIELTATFMFDFSWSKQAKKPDIPGVQLAEKRR